VFANVRINQNVKELAFKNIFVQLAMDDIGLSLGVALWEISQPDTGIRPHRLALTNVTTVFKCSGYGMAHD
jgi:predicted NodU family carbamoyl transferase